MRTVSLSSVIGLLAGVMLISSLFGSINSGTAEAAGGPTVYAEFNSANARGLVQVDRFMSGTGSHVTAKIARPESGVVGFCVFFDAGSFSCQTVNPDFSTYSKGSRGCVEFDITFSMTVTHAAVFDANFVNLIASAPFSETSPRNVGKLNSC